MKTVISLEDLKSLFRKGIVKKTADVQESEVGAFVSGLLASIGMAVINIAIDQKKLSLTPTSVVALDMKIGCLFLFVFDFDDLKRAQLISELEASSGLSQEACDLALCEVEDVIGRRLNEGDEVEIERLGTFFFVDGSPWKITGRIIRLELSQEISVSRI